MHETDPITKNYLAQISIVLRLRSFELGKNFLDETSKSRSRKENDKLDMNKIKIFCSSKECYKDVNLSLRLGENIWKTGAYLGMQW